jgi:hypothetical protein
LKEKLSKYLSERRAACLPYSPKIIRGIYLLQPNSSLGRAMEIIANYALCRYWQNYDIYWCTMKNFFKSVGLQLVCILATVSGFIAALCFVGLILSFSYEILALLIGSSLVFGITVYLLRIKKVTFAEFFSAIWFASGPQ